MKTQAELQRVREKLQLLVSGKFGLPPGNAHFLGITIDVLNYVIQDELGGAQIDDYLSETQEQLEELGIDFDEEVRRYQKELKGVPH